jgi:hypothetical protein
VKRFTGFFMFILAVKPRVFPVQRKHLKLKGGSPVGFRYFFSPAHFLCFAQKKRTIIMFILALFRSVKPRVFPVQRKHLKLKGGSPVGFRYFFSPAHFLCFAQKKRTIIMFILALFRSVKPRVFPVQRKRILNIW